MEGTKMYNFLIVTMLFTMWMVAVSSVSGHESEHMAKGADTESSVKETAEVRYITHIKPIFETRCSACHGSESPEHGDFMAKKERWITMMKGPRMDTYSHLISYVGWPDTGALMRRLDDGKNTGDGKPGNMYQHLGDTEEERQKNLKLFKEWVGNWTLKRWKEITKEEIEQIKVRY